MDVGVGIEHESLAGCQKQPGMLGRLGQQALHELEAEGKRGAHQLQVLIRFIDGVAGCQRVPDHIDGRAANGASCREEKQDNRKQHTCFGKMTEIHIRTSIYSIRNVSR